MKDPWKKYQLVWPKDRRARDGGPDGLVDRLSDIARGKGPDMFIARAGEGIKADRWGNWDAYHSRNHHYDEQRIRHSLWNKARGTKRYDPESRTYREWALPSDFYNDGVDGWGKIDEYGRGYVHFTDSEWRKMAPELRKRNGRVNPLMMGDEWSQDGPKRFDAKHDHFWRHAHRIGENREFYRALDYDIRDPFFDQVILPRDKFINPLLTMRDPVNYPSPHDELTWWVFDEG